MRWLLLVLVLGCDDPTENPGTQDAETDGRVGEEDATAGDGDGGGVDLPPCFTDTDCEAEEFCHRETEESLEGSCRPGERASDCTPEEDWDAERGRCVPRPVGPCVRDVECPDDEWCSPDGCAPGCRDRGGACGPDAVCDAETRVCVAYIACCQEDRCERTLPDRCEGQALLGFGHCSPNPCTAQCASDAECGDAEYCDPDGRCRPGCRPGVAGTCPPELSCEPGNRVCGLRACEGDADCEPRHFCEEGLCRLGCREGGCEAPLRCHLERRSCVELCEEDAECGEGYCDGASGRCRAPCEVNTHAGCEAGERCAAALPAEIGRCVPGCADDPAELEGDDDPDTARFPEVPDVEGRRRLVEDAVVCPGDADFRVIELAGHERLRVRVLHDPAAGELVLRVLGGAELHEDASPAAEKRWTQPGAGGAYQIEVAPLGARVPYRLEVEISALGCFLDERDPGDDQWQTATEAGARNAPRFVDRFEGDLCGEDEDWFCFPMSPDDGLDLVLVSPQDCEAALSLQAQTQLALGEGEPAYVGGDAMETPEGWVRRLEVLPGSGGFSNDRWCARLSGACEAYDLSLVFTRRGVFCNDPAEPNESLQQAVPLDGDGLLGGAEGLLPRDLDLRYPEALRVCPGDADYFSLGTEPGDIVRAWIEGDDARGEITVGFVDARGQARGNSAGLNPTGVNEPRRAAAVSADAERLFVRVAGGDGAEGGYELILRREAGQGVCANDLQETPESRNDEPNRALRLNLEAGRASVGNAALCHPDEETVDEDWYHFRVPEARSRLCLTAGFPHREGNLDLELFAAREEGVRCNTDAGCGAGSRCIDGRCAAPMAEARSRNDGEVMALAKQRLEAGKYLLRVHSPEGEQNGYDLNLSVTGEAGACERDWRERALPNDDLRSATPLGSGRVAVCDAWICQAERGTGDWYSVRVPAGADRSVVLSYEGRGDGSLVLTLVDPTDPMAGVIESVEGSTSHQCINIHGGAEEAQVFIGVTADAIVEDGDDRVDYLLHVAPVDLRRSPRGACDEPAAALHVDWPEVEL